MARRTIGPIVSDSLSVGSTSADRQPLLLLERRQAGEVGELGVVEVRLGEPAVDPGGDGARLLRRRGRRPRASPPAGRAARTSGGRSGSRVLTTMTVGSRPLGDRLRQGAEQRRARRRRAARTRPSRRGPRAPPRAGSRSGRCAVSRRIGSRARGHVLAGERGERVLGLGAHGLGDARGHDVHHATRSRRSGGRARRRTAAPAPRGGRRGPGRGSAGCRARRAA